MYNLMYNKIIIFLFMIGSVRIYGITRNTQSGGFLFTKQDRLRIQLSRFNKFQVLGKHDCSTLINKWKEGYDVVYAKRKTTETTLIKKIMRKTFYMLFKNFVNQKYLIPENTGDFRLLNRKIVDQIINMRERTRFLRGLVSFVGYKQFGIEFDRPFRKKGNSKSNISFLIKYGFDAIFSSTSGPAGLITKIGIFSISIVFMISIFVFINKFFRNPYEGFSLTILLILFLFSLNTFMIGIVGEYVTRIYDEVKQRPNYIIDEIIDNEKNF